MRTNRNIGTPGLWAGLLVAMVGIWLPQRGTAQLQLGTPSVYSVSTYPSSIAIGDLNGDGKPDIAVANYTGSSVTVLLNRGDGTFGPGINYSVEAYPWTVVLADVNGDGKLDLVTPGMMSGDIVVRLGLGDGTFGPVIVSSALAPPYGYPEGLAVGDLDGDGKADVVLANTSANCVTVAFGDGLGGFYSPTNYPADPGCALVMADLNGDGKLDLAIPNYYSSSDVSVLLNQGNGTFSPATNFPTGGSAGYSILARDVTGDGVADLIIANNDSQSVSVLLGRGDGTFSGPLVFPVGDYARGLATGDFDSNGRLDLAVSTWGGHLFVLKGDGHGNFSPQYTQTPGGVSFAVAAADLDGNGTADLVRANYVAGSIDVLLNYTPPTLSASRFGSQMVLTWHALPGFVLEEATSASSTNWLTITNGISYTNGNAIAMPSLDGSSGFFRLKKGMSSSSW